MISIVLFWGLFSGILAVQGWELAFPSLQFAQRIMGRDRMNVESCFLFWRMGLRVGFFAGSGLIFGKF